MVTMTRALGPTPSDPMSQSSKPPVMAPLSEQTPLVVPKLVYVKLDGG